MPSCSSSSSTACLSCRRNRSSYRWPILSLPSLKYSAKLGKLLADTDSPYIYFVMVPHKCLPFSISVSVFQAQNWASKTTFSTILCLAHPLLLNFFVSALSKLVYFAFLNFLHCLLSKAGYYSKVFGEFSLHLCPYPSPWKGIYSNNLNHVNHFEGLKYWSCQVKLLFQYIQFRYYFIVILFMMCYH